MKEYLLGVDIGTGGCKVTIIDVEGQFIADGYTEYPTLHPFVGWAEQNPDDWFPAFLSSFRTALARGGVDPKDIIGLAVDASAHNAVLLGDDNRPLRNTIMWTDQRSVEEAAWLQEHYGDDIFRIGYQKPSPTWTLPQLIWIRKNDPDAFRKAKKIMFIKDYIRWQLTGVWCTDHIEAQGSLLFDNVKWNWSKELCAMGEIPMDLLPPIQAPSAPAGTVTAKAAALTGLREGTPVVTGASDTALECYAVGAVEEGSCVVKMATASTVCVFRPEAHPNPKALTYSHVVDGLWYTCLSTSSAAASLRWYRDVFCGKELDEERAGGKDVYQLLDKEAEQVPPGCAGLIFHPYLMGERSPYWDNMLRGSFTGITAHHGRGHFNRAILEGVAFSVMDNFTLVENEVDIAEVRFVGGGAKSPLWRSILANVVNRPVLKYQKDDSSLGAALLAGVGIGIFGSHTEAAKKGLKLLERVEPDPETVEAYKKHFSLYREITQDLVGTYHKL